MEMNKVKDVVCSTALFCEVEGESMTTPTRFDSAKKVRRIDPKKLPKKLLRITRGEGRGTSEDRAESLLQVHDEMTPCRKAANTVALGGS
jgi:hypothetical protein